MALANARLYNLENPQLKHTDYGLIKLKRSSVLRE